MIFAVGTFSTRMLSLLFLAFAFVLAIFSLFYADWYQKNVTGYSNRCNPGEPGCPSDSGSGSDSGSSGGGSSEPSNQVIQQSNSAVSEAETILGATSEILEYINIPPPLGETPVASSGGGTSSTTGTIPVISPVLTPPSSCSSNRRSSSCLSELNAIQAQISNAVITVSGFYGQAVINEKEYYGNRQLAGNRRLIGESLIALRRAAYLVDQQVVYTNTQITERNERIAKIVVEQRDLIDDNLVFVDDYIDRYGSNIPPATFGSVISECSTNTELILLNRINIGKSGFNQNGLCTQEILRAKPFISGGGSGAAPPIVPPGIIVFNQGPGSPSHSSGNFNGLAFYFEPQLEENGTVEGFVAALSPAGNFILGFLSSSSFSGLGQKISDFVERVTLGLHDDNLVGVAASAGAYDASLGRREIPWFLWAALVFVVVPFLVFGKYLAPAHQRLIFDGRRAIFKNDFLKASVIYEEMVRRHKELNKEDCDDVRQEILEYFIVLRSALRAANIKFEISLGANKFPSIFFEYGKFAKSYTNFQRVEKLLHDSLSDLKNNKRRAVLRAPTIANLYSQLENQDKERLASLYEHFIYSLRDVKR